MVSFEIVAAIVVGASVISASPFCANTVPLNKTAKQLPTQNLCHRTFNFTMLPSAVIGVLRNKTDFLTRQAIPEKNFSCCWLFAT
jgi:hypothetical protein